MNDLEKYFAGNTGKLMDKWKHYFEIYDRHFSRFRGTDVHLVEFGVYQGGSLQMWKNYFGPKAKIYGVDINPHCKQLEEDQVEIFIGDQEDRSFLKSLAAKIPRIDILLDDGGHTMKQQIHTFEELFPRIDKNGVYLCEDLHTSYWPPYGGGYKKAGTFVEYSKNFIDQIHAWHSQDTHRLAVSEFTRSACSLHYYDSILVIEKRPVEKPSCSQTGTATIPIYEAPSQPNFASATEEKELVWKFFGQRRNGVFVEVGAKDPVTGSQTWLLEQNGWHGVLAEPQSANYERVCRQRKNSQVFQVACSSPDMEGEMDLLPATEDSSSTLQEQRDTSGTRFVGTERVKVTTLDKVLLLAGLEKVDFLSLDVGGHAIAVMRGLDFEKFHPALILIEDGVRDLCRHRFLKARGYKLVKRTRGNNWYVPRECDFQMSSLPEKVQLFRKMFLALPFRKMRLYLRSRKAAQSGA